MLLQKSYNRFTGCMITGMQRWFRQFRLDLLLHHRIGAVSTCRPIGFPSICIHIHHIIVCRLVVSAAELVSVWYWIHLQTVGRNHFACNHSGNRTIRGVIGPRVRDVSRDGLDRFFVAEYREVFANQYAIVCIAIECRGQGRLVLRDDDLFVESMWGGWDNTHGDYENDDRKALKKTKPKLHTAY